MPKGPQGQKRPADVIGNAVHVMRIATGQIEETGQDPATEANRRGERHGSGIPKALVQAHELQWARVLRQAGTTLRFALAFLIFAPALA